MKNLTTIVLISLSSFFYSQVNLVPNPSFEGYTNCPLSAGEIPTSWYNCGGSPDYYNVCAIGSSTPSMGVPSNWIGYQNARTGNGYIGLSLYAKNASPNREFLGVQLSQTLTIGTKYFVSAYISRRDTSNSFVGYACPSDKFCLKFSSVAFSYTNTAPINNFSQVYSNIVVNDTLGWSKISGSFVADSSYKFLMLGNFFDNSNTTISACTHSLSVAYYYIDDVCLSMDSTLCNSSVGIFKVASYPEILVYPNPAQDFLMIKFTEPIVNSYVFVVDLLGNLIFEKTINNENFVIDLKDFDDGFYTVKITNNNITTNYKLLKQAK